jgi:4-amino-4-deoxy-L-arabinose transferase-like glycosyltransferase
MKSSINSEILLFLLAILIRLVFIFAMGFNNNFQLQPDSYDLIKFADQSVIGNFNFDYGRFIASPGFPIFAALHKLIFLKYWKIALVLSQLLLSALSVVFLYKISKLVFKDELTSKISAILFCFFPLTFWYVHTFCQETLFQSLFIFSIFHLIKAYQQESLKSLLISSMLFSLAFLTKSHILLFSVFIPIILLIHFKNKLKALSFSAIFAIVCISSTLPYGLYQKAKNDTYILSSNGSGILFYLGNTNAGYVSICDVPEKGSQDYIKMKDMTVTAGYFNNDEARFKQILNLPPNKKQGEFLKDAIKWLEQNPSKIIKMKIYDIALFLIPGVSYRHYDFKEWLLSFILSFPLYLFAYIGLIISMKRDFKGHFYFLSIFTSMLLFSTIFYVQNRFRTITIEPFYIIYCAFTIRIILNKFPQVRKYLENYLFNKI